MAYVTFQADMRSVGNEARQSAKKAGEIIRKNISDPFAIFFPLSKQVAILMWCGLKSLSYLGRKAVS